MLSLIVYKTSDMLGERRVGERDEGERGDRGREKRDLISIVRTMHARRSICNVKPAYYQEKAPLFCKIIRIGVNLLPPPSPLPSPFSPPCHSPLLLSCSLPLSTKVKILIAGAGGIRRSSNSNSLAH